MLQNKVTDIVEKKSYCDLCEGTLTEGALYVEGDIPYIDKRVRICTRCSKVLNSKMTLDLTKQSLKLIEVLRENGYFECSCGDNNYENLSIEVWDKDKVRVYCNKCSRDYTVFIDEDSISNYILSNDLDYTIDEIEAINELFSLDEEDEELDYEFTTEDIKLLENCDSLEENWDEEFEKIYSSLE